MLLPLTYYYPSLSEVADSGGGQMHKDKETDKQRDRHRQTDRQTDKDTERDRQKQRETDRDRERRLSEQAEILEKCHHLPLNYCNTRATISKPTTTNTDYSLRP